ncbi:hypothetical protein GK047_01545 [Paenibacillus sp. SYP-B3998]|uniref:Uncharacterized protein n=2 Tax=Paenibacillus sp. SYP-B3998 TaxID=2678564 RepID=A0A6G3ZR68_9BACL|nr:hypothetical protein [Paenibacillus sp. SYP-B3998]
MMRYRKQVEVDFAQESNQQDSVMRQKKIARTPNDESTVLPDHEGHAPAHPAYDWSYTENNTASQSYGANSQIAGPAN